MAELLFILTIVFVAYVVYVSVNANKDEETTQAASPLVNKPSVAVKTEASVKPKPTVAKPKPVAMKPTSVAKSKPAIVKPKPAAAKSKPAAKPKPAAEKAKPTAKPKPSVATKPTAAKSKPTAKPKAPAAKKIKPAKASDSVKNPDTGEIAKMASSYRFTKRWIKDAMVAEGLLDKVYKNNELTDATTKKIDNAYEQLKAMKKYQ